MNWIHLTKLVKRDAGGIGSFFCLFEGRVPCLNPFRKTTLASTDENIVQARSRVTGWICSNACGNRYSLVTVTGRQSPTNRQTIITKIRSSKAQYIIILSFLCPATSRNVNERVWQWWHVTFTTEGACRRWQAAMGKTIVYCGVGGGSRFKSPYNISFAALYSV